MDVLACFMLGHAQIGERFLHKKMDKGDVKE